MIPILIVEDMPKDQEIIRFFIERAQLQCNIILTPTFIDEYNDAMNEARKGIYPLALIDLHLKNNMLGVGKEVEEFQGGGVISEIRKNNPHAVIGASTGYAEQNVDRLVTERVDAILHKGDKLENLLNKFINLIEKTRDRFNYDIDPDVNEALAIAFRERRTITEDERKEYDICLRRLLRGQEKTKVSFNHVGSGRSGAGIVALYVGDQLPKVLKFDDFVKLNDERKRYEKHVANYISQCARTSRDNLARAGTKGILAYSFVGLKHATITLSGAIGQEKGNQVSESLRKYFNESCLQWFSMSGSALPIPLDSYCRKHFRVAVGAMQNLTIEVPLALQKAAEYLGDGITKEKLVEVISHAVQTPRRKIFCKPETRIHGDLNANNLIWDKGSLWMIDFAMTDKGHRLTDFVKLEASIKFDVPAGFEPGMSIEDMVQASLAFEEILLEGLHKRIPKAGKINLLREGLQKKLKAICTIRECAKHQCGPEPETEYCLALFFITVKHVEYLFRGIREDSAKYVPLVHALVSAYRLSQKVVGNIL